MVYKSRNFDVSQIFNVIFTLISVAACLILMLLPIPGTELLNTNPNWLFIWLVSWSLKRTVWQGAIAGVAIGWIYDGIASTSPSYVFAFVLVGVLTSALNTQRYLDEDFISVAFIVFFMTLIAKTVFALQYLQIYFLSISDVWYKYRQITIVSAIITSLWSPVFYYPFNLIQRKVEQLSKRSSSYK